MPTVLRVKGYRFYFFSNEGVEPKHIHIEKAEASGKMWIEPSVEAEYFFNFTSKEVKEIVEIVLDNLEHQKNLGMNTLDKKIVKLNAKDPLDILIFENGLRIKNVIIDKELDLIGVILNNGKILESRISHYPKLEAASETQLGNWKLISKGIGVSWEELDEDLSVKGFIRSVAINEMIEHLQSTTTQSKASA